MIAMLANSPFDKSIAPCWICAIRICRNSLRFPLMCQFIECLTRSASFEDRSASFEDTERRARKAGLHPAMTLFRIDGMIRQCRTRCTKNSVPIDKWETGTTFRNTDGALWA